MRLWKSDGRFDLYVPHAMAKLAHLSRGAALLGGLIVLILVVVLDGAGRSLGLRLVPLYVPLLCVMSWILPRRWGIGFAIITAMVALLPDIWASPAAPGAATAGNALVRAAVYIFLALIIAAYRRAYDEADYRAMYDVLTGVLNKIPFQTAMVRHLAAARRARQTSIVACVDLDGFKAVTGSHGYSAGDGVLRAFSREAMSAIRGSDLLGRLGQDEFGFLLNASAEHGAEGFARLLHQRLTTALTKTGLPLSCSMGALIVPPRADLAEAPLLDRAAALMNRAQAQSAGAVIVEIVEEPTER